MADNINRRLEYIYNLLLQDKVTIISHISDDLKCVICKNVLINAYMNGDCGCSLCKKCIDEYLKNGDTYCPGNTKECIVNDIKKIEPDPKTNLKIFKLIGRCNAEQCGYEGELKTMASHKEECNRKSGCPFETFGCKEIVHESKLNEHLTKETHQHDTLLLEIINNLRNEMNELKENEKRNKEEIETLKGQMIESIKTINYLKEASERLSAENAEKIIEIENLSKEMRLVENKLNTKNKTDEKYKREIEELKEKEERNKKAFETFSEESNRRFDVIMTEIESIKGDMVISCDNRRNISASNESKKWIESVQGNEVRPMISKEIHCKTNLVDNDASANENTFLWHIGPINKLVKERFISSDHFYIKNGLYEMGLRLIHSGNPTHKNTYPHVTSVLGSEFIDNSQLEKHFSINGPDNMLYVLLLRYKSKVDKNLILIDHVQATITIMDKADHKKNLSDSEMCTIHKCYTELHHKLCKLVIFDKYDIYEAGISMEKTDCVIECHISYGK